MYPEHYRVMPWKNGLGSTTEIYRLEGGDGHFDWRVSIAQVTADGAFSLFPGYDRHIMVIDGNGMWLRGAPQELVVAPALNPVGFSGDWDIKAHLIDGPVRDFNFIVRRDRYRSRLACLDLSRSMVLHPASGLVLIHILSGDLRLGDLVVPEGCSALISDDTEVLAIPSMIARVAACYIWDAAGKL